MGGDQGVVGSDRGSGLFQVGAQFGVIGADRCIQSRWCVKSLTMPDTPDLFADLGPEFAPQPARLEISCLSGQANMGKFVPHNHKLLQPVWPSARTQSPWASTLRHCRYPALVRTRALMMLVSRKIVLATKKHVSRFWTTRYVKPRDFHRQPEKQQATRPILLNLCVQAIPASTWKTFGEIDTLLSRYLSPERPGRARATPHCWQRKRPSLGMATAIWPFKDLWRWQDFKNPEW